MANVFNLYGKISIDTSGFMSALSIAQKAISVTAKAVTNFAKSSVQSGMTFDKSMSQVAATMGKTVDEIDDLREFAKKMGSETAFSASQAADALNYMALAGYDAETSMNMLPNVLNLAASGGMELARASDMITDTQSALGLSLSQTAELVDKMAKGASKTNTSVGQLGDAMLTVGGTAKMLSGGTTELATALGLLADNGTKGAEGGTALRNIILSLSAPTDKAAAALEDLGVQAFDNNGKMRDLQSIFSDFNSALSDMTDAEKTQTLNSIFNKVDLKSVNALLATSTDRWKEVSSAIDGADFSISSFRNAFNNLGGNFDEVAERVSQLGISSDEFFDILQGSAKDSTVVVDALDEALGGAFTFDEIRDALGDMDLLQEALDQTTGAAEEMAKTQLDNLSGDITIFQSALEGVQIALSDKLTPTLRKFVKFGTDGLSRLTTAFNEKGLLGAMSEFGSILSDGLLMIVEMTPQILEVGSAILSAIGQGILDNLPMILDVIVKVVEQIITDLGRALPTLISALPKFIESLMNAIDWDNLLDIIINIIDIIADALIDVLPQLTEAVMTLIEKIVEFVLKPETLSKLVELCAKVMIAVSTALLAAAPKLLVGVGKIIKVVVDYIVNTDWKKLGQDLMNNINKAISKAAEKLMKWWDGWSQQIGKYAVIAWNEVVRVWSGVGQWFSDRWQDIKNAFKSVGDWFKMVFEGAWNGITGAFSAVGNFFNNVWNGIKNAFITTGEWFGNVFTGAWNGIKNAFSNVKNFFVEVWNGIKSVFTNVGTWFTDIFKRAWEGIKNVFAPVGTTFQNIGDSILNGLKSVVNSLIWGINQIISLPFNKLNDALRGIKGIDILGAKPFDWINEIAVPQIPYLARGGVLKRGQMAFLEGQGDEAVIPLSQNTEWIDKVAEKLGEKRQSVYYNFEIHIDKMGQTSEDDIEQFADRLMEVMNEKESRRRYVMA